MRRRDFLHRAGQAAFIGAVSGAVAVNRAVADTKVFSPIKIGQIGTKRAHAAGKMAALRKLHEYYQVVGIVEPDPAAHQAVAQHKAYRDLPWLREEQLLNTPGLQAVAVETAIEDLIPCAARCVAAGKHLHLDKPAGPSMAAYQRLLREADQKGLTVQMGYMFRNNPAFQFCFRAVREGWLGDVFEINAVIGKKISPAARQRYMMYAGGSMFELGCHLIDAAVALMGKPDKVTPFLQRTRPHDDKLVDNALAVLEYARATHTIRSAVVDAAGFQRRQFVVCGDLGAIEIRPLEPPRLILTLEKAQGTFQRGSQELSLPKMPGRYDEQLIELARIIRGEIPSPYPSSHDVAAHEAILRASGMLSV